MEAYPGISKLIHGGRTGERHTFSILITQFEKVHIEKHGGEGLQIIMHKKVSSSLGKHYININF